MQLILKVPPPVQALICGILMWVVDEQLPGGQLELAIQLPMAILFAISGIVLVAFSMLAFRRAGHYRRSVPPRGGITARCRRRFWLQQESDVRQPAPRADRLGDLLGWCLQHCCTGIIRQLHHFFSDKSGRGGYEISLRRDVRKLLFESQTMDLSR